MTEVLTILEDGRNFEKQACHQIRMSKGCGINSVKDIALGI